MSESENCHEVTAIELLHLLAKSTNFIQREFKAQLTALQLPIKVSGPRLRLLSIVAQASEIRMSELAARLDINARTVTDFADALEKEQLIKRRTDPSDRRATLVSLTPLAMEHLERALQKQKVAAEQLLGSLDCDQKKMLHSLLLQLGSDKDMSEPPVDHLLS